jgi:non-heme chloroperoxidase
MTTGGIKTMPFIQTADGASLFVTEWGSGPPVVFTHAWGLRSDQWDYQVPALAAAGMRCVLYDRRGHGRSDRPAAGYDLDTMADDLAAVIDHFGLRGITLVAHSLGSKEAVRYLTRHGDSRVARLVLVAPVTPLMRRTADNPGGLDPALIDANYAAVAADVPRWCADFEAAGPYFGASPGSSQGLIDWTTRMIVDTPTRVLLETLKVNMYADLRGELQKIALPTLIVHGDQDASAPIDLTGRTTAALIAGATLRVYPGAGHGLYASDHDLLNADILAFIHGRPLPGPPQPARHVHQADTMERTAR